jgi:site-specific recombinase XerD
MNIITTPRCITNEGATPPTILGLVPGFCEYMEAERHLSPRTIRGYHEAVRFFAKLMGDSPITNLRLPHFIAFKSRMLQRHAGESRIASILNAVKCLLVYARDIQQLSVLDIASIKAPRAPRRNVVYLTPEEVRLFTEAIPLRAWSGKPRRSGHCFRALVETLIATGMRITEALNLDRESIDRVRQEAVIVGKGNRQRTVFFTERALEWVDRYLALRTDLEPALFVSLKDTRLTLDTVEPMFRRTRRWSGLDKAVTPHMLRHTAATNLLRNGCPIGHIKEILGHENLMTTCRYYLGILDKVETKRAHARFSQFEVPSGSGMADDPMRRPTPS